VFQRKEFVQTKMCILFSAGARGRRHWRPDNSGPDDFADWADCRLTSAKNRPPRCEGNRPSQSYESQRTPVKQNFSWTSDL